MEQAANYGIWSLLPALVALALAFITREAIFSLLIGCIVGVLITGQNLLFGFSGLLQKALGNGDFIWVLSIEVFVGIMIAFFQKSGAVDAFSKALDKRKVTAKGAQIIAWFLGIFIFFSDYFSPLFVGTVMRNITDKARVSREKLAYICDSTSAPVYTILPFSSWGVYIAGLLVGIGVFTDKNIATSAVIRMVPYNFYGIVAVLLVGLIAVKIVPEFGPMKAAEKRTMETGKVMNDNAKPLLGKELSEIKPKEGMKPNLFLNFFAPALIIICTTLGTYIFMGSAKTLEGFMLAVVFQFVVLIIQKVGSIVELMETAVSGIKGVTSAIMILGLAYALNAISKELGTAQYVISVTESWMTPALLLVFTFLICAFISFFTGTSWGTYAIMIPIAVPLAFNLTGGALTSLYLQQ
jgi:Na+/H+ antiporter NhaC